MSYIHITGQPCTHCGHRPSARITESYRTFNQLGVEKMLDGETPPGHVLTLRCWHCPKGTFAFDLSDMAYGGELDSGDPETADWPPESTP